MKKAFLLILILSGLAFRAQGQICTGNLGENIFTEGDFGSGTANILTPDPQIAPGYNYQTSPPPNDGWYSISNNTTPWGSFAANVWINIGDNSSDPNGYMMVVNASYETGLFYQQEVDGLCENTLYVFSADVINLFKPLDAIKPNVSFLLDGAEVYNTGNVPENEQWITYGFTFSTAPGQTSVTLALRNNAPGGYGNDLAIDNITFRPCGPEALILPAEVANICEDGYPIDLEATIIGDQYDTPNLQWQQSFDEGMTWQNIPGATGNTYAHSNLSAGYYYYRYLLANDPANLQNSKCRIISNVKVVHVVPKFYTIVDTLCEGLSFSLGDQLYDRTGIYVDSLLTVIGCDSIVTLDLTIIPDEGIKALFNVNEPSCDYSQNGSISIENILNGTGPYIIYIDDALNLDGSIFDLANGDYFYQITDRYGCRFETTVSLQKPPFLLDLGPDLSLKLGDAIEVIPFLSEPADNYHWEPSEWIDCSPDCATLNWAPVSSIQISLSATSSNGGCVASDSMYVEVEDVRKVYFPNVFSPNLDGINDHFTIYGSVPNVQKIEQFKIFDRWGSILFEKEDFLPNLLSEGWDGAVNGKLLPEGVYVYFAKIRFLDDKVILYEGDVTLIK